MTQLLRKETSIISVTGKLRSSLLRASLEELCVPEGSLRVVCLEKKQRSAAYIVAPDNSFASRVLTVCMKRGINFT